MFKNYLKTAWRNIRHNKVTTAINLFGLSVALVAFIFIALWVHNELNFDNYHKNAKDIYLVGMKSPEADFIGRLTPLPLGNVLENNNHVAHMARMAWFAGTLNVNGNLFEVKERAATVDSNWFNIFKYNVISGNINAFNRNPFSLIFTESKAKQIFGNENPVGKIIKVDTTLYQVQAIVKDNPVNSSLQFDMLAPMAARLRPARLPYETWGNFSYRTFIKLNPNTNIAAFTKIVTGQMHKASQSNDFLIDLQPLSDLHFDTQSDDPAFRRGSRTAIYIFSALAILLLIIASINYVNLTIAQANARGKEISIRKIMGGSRTQVFLQFLIESSLLCLMALIISFFVMQLTLPLFNAFTETNFKLSLNSSLLWKAFLYTLLLTILLNGVFPALTMAHFQPLSFLRGYNILKFRNILFRKGLVVFQFVISIVFIIGTIVIYRQMQLAQTSATQYNRSQVVTIRLPSLILKKMNYDNERISLFCSTLKNELLKNSNILSVAVASNSADQIYSSRGVGDYYWNGRDTGLKVMAYHMSVEPAVKNMFNLQMQMGRWYGNDNADNKNYVLNETAVKELKLQEPVVGQMFARNGGDTGRIIGVVKDFSYNSLHNQIGPLIIDINGDLKSELFVKIAPGNIPETMKAIETTWKKFIPDAAFDYQFMNQAFDNLYKDDLKLSKLILLFCSISIIISVLGLFALTTFIAKQKTREIGIRKVLGASIANIVVLFSKEFVLLVVLAFCIAVPIAWYFMHQWLQNFVYRIDINWVVFLIAALLVLVITLLTISFQSIKAALPNPVKSLRME